MNSIILDSTSNKYIISIDKQSIEREDLIEYLDNLRVEFIARNANFTDEIEKLGEELKENWWKENKLKFIPLDEL